MELTKKRKTEDAYENYSKEELLNRVRELETVIQASKKMKTSKENGTNENSIEKKRRIDFSKYKTRHVAIKLLYLGWNYDGYVVQDNTTNTIEDHLFQALIKGCLIENRDSSNYHRCGRTDHGVSSFSQVISLTVRSRFLLDDDASYEDDDLPYCKILNGLLPNDIRVIAWSPVAKDFSARFSCKQRTYKYWFPRGVFDIEAMNEGAQKLIGLHDFRNLCKMDVANGVVNFQREVYIAEIKLFSKNSYLTSPEYDMCYLTIVAKGFLWHQIRCIVSVLFLIGQGKEEVDIIQKLLDVTNYPRKPQYSLSNPLPLNLYSCEFDGVKWKIDQQSLDKVIKTLQSHWTFEAIKCNMLENMLLDCQLLSDTTTNSKDLCSSLFKDSNFRNYKPLLSRPMAHSLEDRVTHFTKKGKLKKKT